MELATERERAGVLRELDPATGRLLDAVERAVDEGQPPKWRRAGRTGGVLERDVLVARPGRAERCLEERAARGQPLPGDLAVVDPDLLGPGRPGRRRRSRCSGASRRRSPARSPRASGRSASRDRNVTSTLGVAARKVLPRTSIENSWAVRRTTVGLPGDLGGRRGVTGWRRIRIRVRPTTPATDTERACAESGHEDGPDDRDADPPPERVRTARMLRGDRDVRPDGGRDGARVEVAQDRRVAPDRGGEGAAGRAVAQVRIERVALGRLEREVQRGRERPPGGLVVDHSETSVPSSLSRRRSLARQMSDRVASSVRWRADATSRR